MQNLVERLRLELAERPLRDAASCPTWPAYARALRHEGRDALAEALELALAPWRSDEDRQRRIAAERRALAEVGGRAVVVWTGEKNWSWWLGPFVLAFIDGDSPIAEPIAERLADHLGPLAAFLLPERTLSLARATDWLLAQDPGEPLALGTTLPGQQRALHTLLTRANARLFRTDAVDEADLELVWHHGFVTHAAPPEPPTGTHAVISLASRADHARFHWPTVEGLRGRVVIGPPGNLTPIARPRLWPEPAPALERHPLALGPSGADVLHQLLAELAERPLARAGTCPSWAVLLDLLLDRGFDPLARWLRAALDDPESEATTDLGRDLTRRCSPSPRPVERHRLHALWKQRGQHAHWFGPFVLAYFDPQLQAERGGLELLALLGVHGALLDPARVYVDVDEQWLTRALEPGDGPTLAPLPCPGASERVAQMLARHGADRVDARDGVRVATRGVLLAARPQRQIWTNVGPIAADSESATVVCCERPEDFEAYADPAVLERFAHVVLVGPRDCLERWPLPATWIREWRSASEPMGPDVA